MIGAVAIMALAIAVLAAAMAPTAARAQATANGQIIITWKVLGGSAPAAYTGKVLPSIHSPMEASVAILDGGGFVPLDAQTIHWYLDDNFIGGGTGAQTISFGAPGHNEIMSLRVEVPTYGGGFLNTAYIAMVDPQVVVVAPYPNDEFATSSISLQAVPYFFNADELGKLLFNWTVNGEAVATNENPQSLTVNLANNAPAGYSLAITLGVQESDNPYLSIGKNVALTSANQ